MSHPAPPFYRSSPRPTHQKAQKVNPSPDQAGEKCLNNTAVPPLVHTNGKGERVLYRSRMVQTVNKVFPQ